MLAFHLPVAAAYVVITATTATIWSLLTWHIRLFIRIKIHGPFSWDDIHCTTATVFAVLQSSLAVVQTSDASSIRARAEKLAWIRSFFYILALGFSMLSMCCLISRVAKRTAQVKVAYGIAVLTALWMLATCFVIGFQCELPTPWVTSPPARCISLFKAWIGITVIRCLLELANVVAVVALLWNVQMPWKPKATVLAAFSIRLLVIPPAVARLKYLEPALHSTAWSYARIDVVILTQISMHVSVILATVPCIRPWLIAFESGVLQASADVRHNPQRVVPTSPKLAPLLPIAMMPPTMDGHRKSVGAWSVRFWSGDSVENSNVTTVEADRADTKRKATKKSMDSDSSKGITRTQSFAVRFEGMQSPTKEQRPTQASRPSSSRHASSYSRFRDFGGLLEVPNAKLKQRTNSVPSA